MEEHVYLAYCISGKNANFDSNNLDRAKYDLNN